MCPFCGADPTSTADLATPSRSVAQATNAWAQTVFGAPRQLASLIERVEVRDEEIERLFTEVIRRDIREERQFTTARRTTPVRVDPATVDPFTISVEALRSTSEYVATCHGCGGSGTATCSDCTGAGRVNCSECHGRGQILRQYKKSSRWINCPTCRGKQTLQCTACRGKGTVNCGSCQGGGCQAAWLTYGQRATPHVVVLPRSPVLDAHRQLSAARPLRKDDVTMFAVASTAESSGPLQQATGAMRRFVHSHQPRIDPRLERISQQQYFKLAVVRRDASYRLAGVTGQLVLSGHDLTVAPTTEALSPIRRRLWLWSGASLVLTGALGALTNSFLGKSAYFDTTNKVLEVTCLATAMLGTLAVGALLREAGPRFRWSRLRVAERAFGAMALAGALLIPLLGLATRPALGQVQAALSAGDSTRARLVAEALEERQGPSKDVLESKDAALMASVPAATGDERLKLLDEVASHAGERAKEAAASARSERLNELHRLLEARAITDAMSRFEQWFPAWNDDPELREQKAKIYDAMYAACPDEACRLQAARKAQQAAASTVRASHVDDVQRQLADALTFIDVLGEPGLTRLQRLQSMATMAAKVASIAPDNPSLLDKAKAATARATSERQKVPLLGSDESIVGELLGSLTSKSNVIRSIALDDTETYVVLDEQGKCRGLYAVGPRGTRVLRSPTWPADRILSQAIGRPVTVKKAATTTGTARWQEGSVPVVARWKDGDLVELRVGAASP